MGRGVRARQCWMGAAVALALHASVLQAQETSPAPAPSPASSAPDVSTKKPAPSATDTEAARDLFWQAHQRFEAQDYATALDLFERSYALSPQPEVVFNIALTHEHLGHCEQALEAYDRYLTAAVAGADRERASEHEAALAKRCGPPPAPSEKVSLSAASPTATPFTEPGSAPPSAPAG